ncbi:YlaH-like family protein [Brevibacillus sp. B_LB10_24]|uniref:YlaH-like family protein n=1 Tax=Brevibacillus sp. B_LB10_24 TaxID=3380645 RepID=UPI0038BBEE3C
MEWFDLASTYEPTGTLTFYDQFRLWADSVRTYIIFVYLIIIYYLGFATRIRMPILKTALLLISLFAGSLIFGILDITLPVRSALFVAVLILVIVRMRIK